MGESQAGTNVYFSCGLLVNYTSDSFNSESSRESVQTAVYYQYVY
jgi:hypothetical protein